MPNLTMRGTLSDAPNNTYTLETSPRESDREAGGSQRGRRPRHRPRLHRQARARESSARTSAQPSCGAWEAARCHTPHGFAVGPPGIGDRTRCPKMGHARGSRVRPMGSAGARGLRTVPIRVAELQPAAIGAPAPSRTSEGPSSRRVGVARRGVAQASPAAGFGDDRPSGGRGSRHLLSR